MEVEPVVLEDRAFRSAPDVTPGLGSSSTADRHVRKLLV